MIVAAGPWTPEVIDPTRAWRPIVPVWGVVADVDLPDPPRHVLEEAGVEELAGGAETARTRRARCSAWWPPTGACRSARRSCSSLPNPELWEGRLRRAGDRFVPGLRHAEVVGLRDLRRGRSPSTGGRSWARCAAQEGLWVAAGHGPWGISTGPASARIVADALLGRAEIPEPLSVGRPRTPPMPPPGPAG